jgi:DNA mismatch repair ATPase MutS
MKTTITQAVGQLFVLAQGGLYVPAEGFRYVPCDCIYTHFPADEDKTMDLGRLGEECVRFKEMFSQATNRSLLLLNETFSTTSFEEGYYIARDSVKALLTKAVRTIYNTHMHKLGEDAEELTRENAGTGAASLIMRTEEGKRSFKVALAKPEGSSYARDIAEKYGVTYDMLVSGS